MTEDTKDRKINEDDILYKLLFPKPIETKTTEPSKESHDLYLSLSLRIHPDKTHDPNDAKLFCAITSAYEKDDLTNLRTFSKMIDKGISHEKIVELSQMIIEVGTAKRTLAYMWCNDGGIMSRKDIESMYVQ